MCESEKLCMLVCVRACVCEREKVTECEYARVLRVCVGLCVCVCVCVCVRVEL